MQITSQKSRLEELRLNAGVRTQQELADLVKCDVQQIGRLERGERKLTHEWIVRLSTALNIHPAAFFDAGEAPSAQESRPVSLATVAETVLPGVDTVDMFTITGNALASEGILDGDHLMIDTSATPKSGDVVVFELVTGRDNEKMARIFDPPFLLSPSSEAAHRKPILIDDAHVTILGVVRGVMRLDQ